jgi:phosphatidylglycerol:prolipoprotein diacylglycerol transferase
MIPQKLYLCLSIWYNKRTVFCIYICEANILKGDSKLQLVAPDPIAFSIGSFDIRWYGVIIALGTLLAVLIAYKRSEKFGISGDDLLDIFLIVLPVAIVGLRVYYVIFNWDEYAGDIGAMLDIRSGGLAIHGGLIFGMLAGWLVCRHKHISILNALDLSVPCIALGQAIGRWGNFFNEEAHGGATDFPIAVLIDGVSYHATFLYESLWCFMLFFLLSAVGKHRHFRGQAFCLYVILYSVERFFVEFLRTDSLMIGPFKQAMVFSFCAVLAGIAFYVFLSRRQRGDSL